MRSAPSEEEDRERRRRILDAYLADYERRKGPFSQQEKERAEQLLDEVFAEEERLAAESLRDQPPITKAEPEAILGYGPDGV
ncbi:hypothetical protein [Streptomyces sp. 6N223]|uniref:hypothetical protein n=1 Tax=Streptomyces sp. 6N223 TaxID=3457412 RepID=UPI003FD26C49